MVMAPMQAIASLEAQQDLPFEVYDRVVAEPTEDSWRDAIAWARQQDCSHFLACVARILAYAQPETHVLRLQCWRRERDGHCEGSQSVGAHLPVSHRLTLVSFTVYKDADLFDFINAPVGKGLPIKEKLRPLIASKPWPVHSTVPARLCCTSVPTTAGTGSETTGTAILDITSMAFKTGIANRAMKPMLGIVDTLNTRSCSKG